jgi:hypothetical protein
MDEIDREHIAATGYLNLNTDANMSRATIDRLTLDPIHAAGFLLSPSASAHELGIDQHTNCLGAVCVSVFLNQKRKRGENVANLG